MLGKTIVHIFLITLLASCASSKMEKISFESLKKSEEKNNRVVPHLVFEKNQKDIEKNADEIMKVTDKRIDKIVKRKKSEVTFQNTSVELDHALNEADKVVSRHYLMSQSSQDKVIRDAATKAVEKVDKWYTKLSFRVDLYEQLKNVKTEGLKGEDLRLVENQLNDLKRNGLNLPKAKRKQLEKIKIELSKLSLKFSKNISESKERISFTKSELDGVSDKILKTFKKDKKGNYLLDPRIYLQLGNVRRFAKKESTRKKAYLNYISIVSKENEKILKKILKLRAEMARVLKYKNYADYSIEKKMAKTSKNAISFIEKLATGLEPKFLSEIDRLEKMKKKEQKNPNAKLKIWDLSYYANIERIQRFSIDHEAMRKYFPLPKVLDGMFKVYEDVFSLKFKEIILPYKWIDDLKGYAVYDKDTEEFMGVIYMDMFPREGKYTHFAHFGLVGGKMLKNGKRQTPLGVLVCNFPKPEEEGEPSLLKYSDVETLFHEFGHALHNALSVTKYLEFHGTSVPRDFVEAPSQMLELWLKEQSVLDQFAGNYKDASDKLPSDYLQRIDESQKAMIAINTRYQLALSLLDLSLHTDKKIADKNLINFANKVFDKYYLAPVKGKSMITRFSHITGGYAAGYYGYMWAQGVAYDLATKFKSHPDSYMSTEVGRSLRDEIYGVGNKREITESIREFLGRDWNEKAFLKELGISN